MTETNTEKPETVESKQEQRKTNVTVTLVIYEKKPGTMEMEVKAEGYASDYTIVNALTHAANDITLRSLRNRLSSTKTNTGV